MYAVFFTLHQWQISLLFLCVTHRISENVLEMNHIFRTNEKLVLTVVSCANRRRTRGSNKLMCGNSAVSKDCDESQSVTPETDVRKSGAHVTRPHADGGLVDQEKPVHY